MELGKGIFEGEVTHLSNQGYGVVKGPDRATWFVRGTWRGDHGRFQTTDEHEGDYRFAELIEILQPSPERRDAPCLHRGIGSSQCFGCPWMMVDYAAQLREKQHRVVYALERVGLAHAPVASIWPSPELYHYRRRAQFKTDGHRLGYAGRQGLCIAPIEDCLVLTPRLQNHLSILRSRLPEEAWKPADGFIWNYLDIDEDSDPQNVPINRRRPFQQANAQQNKAMHTWLAQQLHGLDRTAPVLELFAGSGNLTEVLVQQSFSQILAVEVGPEAIAQLHLKNWEGVQAQRMDLYSKQAAQDLARSAPNTRILLANPPRAGMGALWRLAQDLPQLQTVLLVSCDPSSFANDARRFKQQGFTAEIIQPLDQMPHTPHVEIIARLERSSL